MPQIKWFVVYDGIDADTFAADVARWAQVSEIKLCTDPQTLRQALSRQAGACRVLVGPRQKEIDPINVAAALVHDGFAQQVILLTESQSGSLLTRAQMAGITHVMQRSELNNSQDMVNKRALPDVLDYETLRNRVVSSSEGRHCLHKTVQTLIDLDEPDGIETHQKIAKLPTAGKIVAMSSGRGGVGKTTLTATFGVLAHKWGMKVALVDLDMNCGNLASVFGVVNICDLAALVTEQVDYKKIVRMYAAKPHTELDIALVGATKHPERAEIVTRDITDIITALANEVDLVLVDVPATWLELHAYVLQMADRVALVADERAQALSSLVAAQNFAVRLGVTRTRLLRIINRCDTKGFDQLFLDKASANISAGTTFYVDDGGFSVGETMSAGRAAHVEHASDIYWQSAAFTLAKILYSLGIEQDNEQIRNILHKKQPIKKILRLFK